MKPYLDLLDNILSNGRHRSDRTGTGTSGIFGAQLNIDMRKGFPLLTTKKLHFKSIIHELLWFIKGDTNVKYLNDNGVKIWNEWADGDGELGPIYGYQWRKWRKFTYDNALHDETLNRTGSVSDVSCTIEDVDQLGNAIEKLKTNPDDRRIIVSAWNVGDIDEMRLPPCHYAFHFSTTIMTWDEKINYARCLYGDMEWWNINHPKVLEIINSEKRYLSLQWVQRSNDFFLGSPYNIASYALLLSMVAQVVDMIPYELIGSLGDTHLYLNHIEQAKLQASREPKALPTLILNPDIKNINDFKYEDFMVTGYKPHPHIKGEISI